MTEDAKKLIIEWIDANHQPFDELALKIWQRPEIAFEEMEASRLQMEFMEKQGFKVSRPEGSSPTAFMAEWGSGGPVIGLLGEYDALAGMSQVVGAEKKPVAEGAPGHGCGHNLLGVGAMLAACAAKEALAKGGLNGTIRYYGCPAEEQLVGKSIMAACGYFEGTDVSITWHPNDFTYVTDATMTAMVSAKFRFKGRTAHAGASPEAGRSALDAVELMNVGANYLREHMVDQDRLHYVITNGGLAPNIVPAEAEVWYYVRSPHDAELASLFSRLVNVARGAALMTETEMEYNLIGGCYNTLPNKVLGNLLEKNLMDFAGSPGFDADDLAFAKKIQDSLPQAQVTASRAKPVPVAESDYVLASTPLPSWDSGRYVMGSTDVGDVANIMPTSMCWGATWPVGVPHHSWQAVACAGSPIGLKGTVQMAKAMAGSIYDLAKDPTIVVEAKKEFVKRRNGREYQPIDKLMAASLK
ncbi:amidohydrolase [Deltaproteobacteria bacterium Smac51]|nr:amidohydrolase [Deltaproteobacteria bacterium Smac51]